MIRNLRSLGYLLLWLRAGAAWAEPPTPVPSEQRGDVGDETPAVAAAHPSPGIPLFLELDGGLGIPIGGWADLPAFSDESRFGLGSGGRVSLGWAPNRSPWFTTGLEVGFHQLGTADYETFARRKGVPLRASARWWSVAAGGTVHLPGRGRSTFGLEFHGALGVLAPSGEDRLEGRRYEYEFLQTTLAGWLGARGTARLSSSFEAWTGLEMVVAPGAVRYRSGASYLGDGKKGDGRSRTATSLEPRIGLRTWFDL